jgi:DNA replication licensing factor MCM5
MPALKTLPATLLFNPSSDFKSTPCFTALLLLLHMDFDVGSVVYSTRGGQAAGLDDVDIDAGDPLPILETKRKLREFIRSYRQGNIFPYREQLIARWRREETWLDVDMGDLNEYDSRLLDLLQGRPREVLPLMEAAASDVLRNLAGKGAERSEVQIILKSSQTSVPLRSLTAEHVNHLLKVPGIVISVGRIAAKVKRLRAKCRHCHFENDFDCSGLGGFAELPQKCPQGDECPKFPFEILADECLYADQQELKLQEAPEVVPTGEMPRHVKILVDRALVDRATPGSRVTVIGAVCLFKMSGKGQKRQMGPSTHTPYIQCMGLQEDSSGSGRHRGGFTPQEEEQFLRLSRSPNIYDTIVRAIAPSISGDYTRDIKKAIACQLFSGSRKQLPDGTRLRGDINILLLGDPSTAKSQFLKFVQQVAPIAVYTSGKGSSAAGLTASVIKNAQGDFYLEGGAMVLADGGVVCIDEFDKMRESDRVAIHEAMEQQTISVAKAGITTVLNSRTSVLAAANPIYGRYDDLKTASENIDLMTTILSRFDLIFVVKDIRDEERDKTIARHVMGVHMNAASGANSAGSSAVRASEGELDIGLMKKYISYCRATCAPRLSEEAAAALGSEYVNIRDSMRRQVIEDGGQGGAVPVTVRQLEALVRISESLAKMRLAGEVAAADVTEALRLFRVSTMAAAQTSAVGDVSSLPTELRGGVVRAEEFIKQRIPIRTTANRRRVEEEATGQGHDAGALARAVSIMVMRGEMVEKNRGFLLYRLK